MTEYFSHDYNARNDKKLVKLAMKHGVAGIGIYWCIVEMLYEEGGYLDVSEYERITFELRTDYETVTSVMQDFELFIIAEKKFYSPSILERLKERSKKSENARKAVAKRWAKRKANKAVNTDVLQMQCERNTIKVNKSKENKRIKEKESKEKEKIDILISENPKIAENLKAFVEMRTAIKKPMTLRAFKMLLKKLDGFTKNVVEQNKILEKSIINSWQDIYRKKEEKEVNDYENIETW